MKKSLQFLVILLGVMFLLSACAQQTTEEEPVIEKDDTTPPEPEGENNILITDSGFSPSTLTISAGTTVTFFNMDDSQKHWPASNPHPSHTGYPEEGTCSGSALDACLGLAPGESWSFTFNEVGTWTYHDHLNPSLSGIVVVE